MQTETIVIQGRNFNAPMPFAEGHVLTAIEASVMNQTFHENLRNNFATKMKKAKEDSKPDLTQEDFDKYASEYKFGARPIGVKKITDPVENRARKDAEAAVRSALAKKGIKVKDLPDGHLNNLVTEALEKHPKFREAARVWVESIGAAAAELTV